MSRHRDDDSALVADARRGSSDARGELFRRHWRAAWARAFTITGRRAMADDVVQDSFLRAFEALGGLSAGRAFPAWLDRIVVNRSIDLLRAERASAELGEVDHVLVEWTDATGLADALHSAVARLTPERRTAVVLRYWLDRTPPEIAALTGVPLGTVNSRLARALADLRHLLDEEHHAG